MTCWNCKCCMFNNRKPTIVGWGNIWDKAESKFIKYFDIEFSWKCPMCGDVEIEEITTIDKPENV